MSRLLIVQPHVTALTIRKNKVFKRNQQSVTSFHSYHSTLVQLQRKIWNFSLTLIIRPGSAIPTYLLEPNLLSILPETLTASVEAIFPY